MLAEASTAAVTAVAIITLAGTVVTSVLAYMAAKYSNGARKQATEANDAVNHKGESQLRLFDMVAEMWETVGGLTEWQKKWTSFPPHLSNAEGVVNKITVVDTKLRDMDAKITTVDTKVQIVDAKVENVKTRLAAVDAKVGNVGGAVEGVAVAVADLAATEQSHHDEYLPPESTQPGEPT